MSKSDNGVAYDVVENLKIVVKELDDKIQFIVALTDEIRKVNNTNEIHLNDFNYRSRLKTDSRMSA
jgi:nucleosome binding factor SPN SPT16 subunit